MHHIVFAMAATRALLVFFPASGRLAFLVRAKREDTASGCAIAIFSTWSSVWPSSMWFALFRSTPPRGATVGFAVATVVTLFHVIQLAVASAPSGAVCVRHAIAFTRFALFANRPTVSWSTFFVCSSRRDCIAHFRFAVRTSSTWLHIFPTL